MKTKIILTVVFIVLLSGVIETFVIPNINFVYKVLYVAIVSLLAGYIASKMDKQ